MDGQRNGVGELVTSHGAEDWVRREPALLVLPPERLEQATIRAQPSAKLAWVEAGQRAQDGRWQQDVRCRVANRTSNGGYAVQGGGVASEHVHEPMMRVLRLTHLAHPQDHGVGQAVVDRVLHGLLEPRRRKLAIRPEQHLAACEL